MLLVGHVPGRGKPILERDSAAVEDRTCRHRYLASASGTGPAPVCHPPAFCSLALWAVETCGPTQLFQIRATGQLAGKPRAELLPGARIGRVNLRSQGIRNHYM